MEKKFDFYLSYNCSSACIFCSSADKMRRYGKEGSLTWDVIRGMLIEKWKRGYRVVVLTGGEPSESKFFLPTLRLAHRLGYRISVNTNLSKFAGEDLACSALPLVDEIVASIHGHTSALHDSIVREEGSFERFQRGMAYIASMGASDKPYLLTDTVLTRQNIDHVAEIVDMIAGFKKLRQLLVSYVNMPPEYRDRFEEVVPRMSQLRAVLPVIVEKARAKNLTLRFYGIPMCILGDYRMHSTDLYYEAKVTIERFMTPEGVLNRERDAPKPLARSQTPRCDGCAYSGLCAGAFDSYLEQCGDEELQPVR